MACGFCLAARKRAVRVFCKKPGSKACQKARAALERRPCPSDAAIAQAYGTRSLGRARRVLAYLEEQGMVVQQQDRQGRRVALVELGWETAPGDANAEAA